MVLCYVVHFLLLALSFFWMETSQWLLFSRRWLLSLEGCVWLLFLWSEEWDHLVDWRGGLLSPFHLFLLGVGWKSPELFSHHPSDMNKKFNPLLVEDKIPRFLTKVSWKVLECGYFLANIKLKHMSIVCAHTCICMSCRYFHHGNSFSFPLRHYLP